MHVDCNEFEGLGRDVSERITIAYKAKIMKILSSLPDDSCQRPPVFITGDSWKRVELAHVDEWSGLKLLPCGAL